VLGAFLQSAASLAANAVRKGLFVVRGSGTRWDIGEPHFVGEPVTQVLADPRDGTWYAALRLGHFGVKLHRSSDQGASWQAVGAPAFPASVLFRAHQNTG